MKRLIAEWTWRLAVLGVLAWMGLELHHIHEDMAQPADDTTTTAAAPDDDLQASVDDLHDEIATLDQKVDAMMIAMVQLKK
jgi:uncharacterized protein YceH (UPF0502 family)